jgi:hypothetical protein
MDKKIRFNNLYSVQIREAAGSGAQALVAQGAD